MGWTVEQIAKASEDSSCFSVEAREPDGLKFMVFGEAIRE